MCYQTTICLPNTHEKTYLATRTKAENYDSIDTLVESEDEDAPTESKGNKGRTHYLRAQP